MQKNAAAVFAVLVVGLMLAFMPNWGMASIIWPAFAIGAGFIVWLVLAGRGSPELGDQIDAGE